MLYVSSVKMRRAKDGADDFAFLFSRANYTVAVSDTSTRRILFLLTKLVVNGFALVVVDAIFSGVWIENNDTWILLAVAIVLALINAYIRPVVLILTIPLNIVTLGLFTLVINALLLWFVSWLIPAFHVDGFWTAFWAALVMSIISVLLNMLLKPPRAVVKIDGRTTRLP
jgi:putative membrane protein